MPEEWGDIINSVLDQQPQYAQAEQPPQFVPSGQQQPRDQWQPVDLNPHVIGRNGVINNNDHLYAHDLNAEMFKQTGSRELARDATLDFMRRGEIPVGDYRGVPLYIDPIHQEKDADQIMMDIPQY